jgi:tRNA A-37 threonylcarbamoyl transferase component Bud32
MALIGQMLDHYRLVEMIGQGGMATVYRALDTRRLKDVAVKVLSSTITGDRRFVRRFRREASLVVRLNHPNIVGVLEYGESHGIIYLAMPFIHGSTLFDRIQKFKVSEEEATRWIGQVSGALGFAHSQGVIHRDIKPSNILIDDAGTAYLTDFGLARMIEGSNTLTGSMMMGTPAYVSPEQGRGRSLDPRSDQYSLGVILYQLATGRLPFEGNSPMATVLMHIQEPIPRPGRFNANLSPGVERVILRAMAKNPEDRYPTVEAMNQAYQAAVRGAPLPEGDSALASASGAGVAVARRPMREGGRRRGWLTWLAVGLGLAVLAGGALALPQLTPLGASVLPPTALPAATAAAPTFAVPTAPVVAAEAPTATPFADPACPGLRLIGFAREGSRVSYKIVNERETAVNIVGLEPSYPADNPLIEMTLGDALLPLPAAGEGTPASLTVSAGENRRLEPGAIRSLTLKFTFVDSQPGLYSLAIIFDDCSLTPSW